VEGTAASACRVRDAGVQIYGEAVGRVTRICTKWCITRLLLAYYEFSAFITTRVSPATPSGKRRDTLPTTFNPFRIPVALSTKGEDRTIARARQMLAEAQATWDNGTSCSYIRHNSPPHETSDVLTSEKIRRADLSEGKFLKNKTWLFFTAAAGREERDILHIIKVYYLIYNYFHE